MVKVIASVILILLGIAAGSTCWLVGRETRASVLAIEWMHQARTVVISTGEYRLIDPRNEDMEPIVFADGQEYVWHHIIRDYGLIVAFLAGLLACWCAYRLVTLWLVVDRGGRPPTGPDPGPGEAPADR